MANLVETPEEAAFEVTEENFHIAYNNAGPLARKRLLRKMNKKTIAKDADLYVKRFVMQFALEENK